MYFTSESVLPGHPDKMADQISDAILDAYLEQDPDSKVAVETFLAAGRVTLGGEVRSSAEVDRESIARQVIREIGYTSITHYDPDTIAVHDLVVPQSAEIHDGVTTALEHREARSADRYDLLGAGDQGIMFGFAVDEPDYGYIAPAHYIAQCIARTLAEKGPGYGLGPDGKVQITTNGNSLDTTLISMQHFANVDAQKALLNLLRDADVFPASMMWDFNTDLLSPERPRLILNPSGRFTVGGPVADTGLTGRKIIVDTYGGAARHGGGAFSGKDPSKVDRSAAYAARQVAKSIVAHGFTDAVEVQIAYGIGIAHPISVTVIDRNESNKKLSELVQQKVDLRPAAIIERLDLKRPIYRETATFGHFGVSDRPWEQVIPL